MKFQERIFVFTEKTEVEKTVYQGVQNISSSPTNGQISGFKREWVHCPKHYHQLLQNILCYINTGLFIRCVLGSMDNKSEKKRSGHIHSFIQSLIHSQSPLSHSKLHITIRKCKQFRIFKLLVRISV